MTHTPMFSGDLAFLSNFDTTPFFATPPLTPRLVKSGEHLYQSLKNSLDAAFILDADTPKEAKRRGRATTPLPGWNQGYRVYAMRFTIQSKFAHQELREKLLSTGNIYLSETNSWHDNFWGDCYCPGCENSTGTNMLGELLMAERARILTQIGHND